MDGAAGGAVRRRGARREVGGAAWRCGGVVTRRATDGAAGDAVRRRGARRAAVSAVRGARREVGGAAWRRRGDAARDGRRSGRRTGCCLMKSVLSPMK
jgi:hypothetical protein